MFNTNDTIVAIATPQGRGGLGVVRLSGPDSVAVAHQLLNSPEPLQARRATFGRVVESVNDGLLRAVDDVVVTWFAAPHSYTGDDVVEISGHGSPVLLEHIVRLSICAGARMAEPGEFTLRAYLNGKLDLVQAEAVGDLINAVTPAQARVAMDQLTGTVTSAIRAADLTLLDLIAKCEASLDFPDEGFHFIQASTLGRTLAGIVADLDRLLSTAGQGRLIREGLVVAIAGRPNVGKSSLFNALLGRNRAIVTPVAGTTRDLLTEHIDLGGVPCLLVDTAGVRVAPEAIEQEGVARASEARRSADLVLLVLDGSVPITDIERQLLAETTGPRVICVNKSDRPPAWSSRDEAWTDEAVSTSVVSGRGLGELRDRLARTIGLDPAWRESATLSNVRHIGLVQVARDALVRAERALSSGATEEMLLVDLHEARGHLESVSGRRTVDDVLRHIFANFCIGK